MVRRRDAPSCACATAVSAVQTHGGRAANEAIESEGNRTAWGSIAIKRSGSIARPTRPWHTSPGASGVLFDDPPGERGTSSLAAGCTAVPELPEVEHLRRTLEPLVVGAVVGTVNLRRRSIVRAPKRGRVDPVRLLAGRRIIGLDRRGKQLAILADSGGVLVIHLGMTGRLFVRPDPRDAPRRATPSVAPRTTPDAAPYAALEEPDSLDHVHCTWRLHRPGGRTSAMIFRDPRRFGGLWCIDSREELLASRWTELGPDALAVTPADLMTRLGVSRRAVKAALLDQHAVAGVGNIYADEALHRAGIHPMRRAALLQMSDWERLADAIRMVMGEALRSGGSTLRDYVDAEGRPGEFAWRHRVYGRGGEPCLGCDSRLRSIIVAQRTTVYCPTCQPMARNRKR